MNPFLIICCVCQRECCPEFVECVFGDVRYHCMECWYDEPDDYDDDGDDGGPTEHPPSPRPSASKHRRVWVRHKVIK